MQQDGGYPQTDGVNSWENHQGVPPGQQNSTYPPHPADHWQFQDYPSGPSLQGQQQPNQQGGYDDDVGPQITADIDRYLPPTHTHTQFDTNEMSERE